MQALPDRTGEPLQPVWVAALVMDHQDQWQQR
jgi:hypothetical protein